MRNQSAVQLLRAQYSQSWQWLQGTLQGLTADLASYQPADLISPIAGQAAHTIAGLDFMILGAAAGRAPLATSTFAGNTGISELPPQGGGWLDWGKTVQVDWATFDTYAGAVFNAIDDYLQSINDDELDRDVSFPFGTHTVAWAFNTMLLNTYSHTGEIACIKGLQGTKGYAM